MAFVKRPISKMESGTIEGPGPGQHLLGSVPAVASISTAAVRSTFIYSTVISSPLTRARPAGGSLRQGVGVDECFG